MSSSKKNEELHRELLWKSTAGIFYHQKLESRYRGFLKLSSVVTLFLSLGAVASIQQLIVVPHLPTISTLLLAALSALVLGFDIQNSATRHNELGRNWIRLKTSVQEAWDHAEVEKCNERLSTCRKQAADIDEQEPATKSGLSHWAGWKAAKSLGLDEPQLPIFQKIQSPFWN